MHLLFIQFFNYINKWSCKNIKKKSLGQNFLIDNNIINKIIEIGNIQKNKTILEVSTRAIKYGFGCYLDGKHFYIRRNPGTDKLEGKDVPEYQGKHFKQERP